MPRLSARQYAQRIGVSGSYVSRLVREGKLPVDAEGRIDPDEADRILAATREPARRAKRLVAAPPPAVVRSSAPQAPRPATPPTRLGSGLAQLTGPGGSDPPTLLLKPGPRPSIR
jgi:hypothetical protein